MLDFWLHSTSFAVGVHQRAPPRVSWSVRLSSDVSLSPDIFCVAVLRAALSGMSGISSSAPASWYSLCQRIQGTARDGNEQRSCLLEGGSRPARLALQLPSHRGDCSRPWTSAVGTGRGFLRYHCGLCVGLRCVKFPVGLQQLGILAARKALKREKVTKNPLQWWWREFLLLLVLCGFKASTYKISQN